jgi:hypothetical protein
LLSMKEHLGQLAVMTAGRGIVREQRLIQANFPYGSIMT